MKKATSALILALTMAIMATVTAANAQTTFNIDDYRYRVPVSLVNETADDLSGVLLPVTFNADGLETMHFLDALVGIGSAEETELPGFAQDLDSDAATWWVAPDSLPAGASSTAYFWMGGESDDAVTPFPLDGSLNVEAEADSSQTITSGLRIVADVDLSNAEDGWILNKDDSYGLGVQGGLLNGFASTGPTTTILRPNGQIGNPSWTQQTGSGAEWELIDDETADFAVTRLFCAGSARCSGVFEVTSPPDTASAVTSLTVGVVAQRYLAGISPTIRVTTTIGGVESQTDQIVTCQWCLYTFTMSYPSGTVVSDVDDMTVGVAIVSGTSANDITQVFATIGYVGQVAVTATIPDAQSTITLRHVGNDLELLIDEGLQDSATVGSAISVTAASDVEIGTGELRGQMYDLRLRSATDVVLRPEWDPGGVTLTQEGDGGNNWLWEGEIDDGSNENVTITYSYTRDMTGITLLTGPLEILQTMDGAPIVTGGGVESAEVFQGVDVDNLLVGTGQEVDSEILAPLQEAAKTSPLGEDGFWLILGLMFSQLAAAVVVRFSTSLTAGASAGSAVMLLFVLSAYLAWWFAVIYAIWAFSVTAIHQFAK